MRLHYRKFLFFLFFFSFFNSLLISDLIANPKKKDQFFDDSINLLAVLNDTAPYNRTYDFDLTYGAQLNLLKVCNEHRNNKKLIAEWDAFETVAKLINYEFGTKIRNAKTKGKVRINNNCTINSYVFFEGNSFYNPNKALTNHLDNIINHIEKRYGEKKTNEFLNYMLEKVQDKKIIGNSGYSSGHYYFYQTFFSKMVMTSNKILNSLNNELDNRIVNIREKNKSELILIELSSEEFQDIKIFAESSDFYDVYYKHILGIIKKTELESTNYSFIKDWENQINSQINLYSKTSDTRSMIAFSQNHHRILIIEEDRNYYHIIYDGIHNARIKKSELDKNISYPFIEKWEEKKRIEEEKILEKQRLEEEKKRKLSFENLSKLSIEELKELQENLKMLGFYQSTVDGVFGDGTLNAFKDWIKSKEYEEIYKEEHLEEIAKEAAQTEIAIKKREEEERRKKEEEEKKRLEELEKQKKLEEEKKKQEALESQEFQKLVNSTFEQLRVINLQDDDLIYLVNSNSNNFTKNLGGDFIYLGNSRVDTCQLIEIDDQKFVNFANNKVKEKILKILNISNCLNNTPENELIYTPKSHFMNFNEEELKYYSKNYEYYTHVSRTEYDDVLDQLAKKQEEEEQTRRNIIAKILTGIQNNSLDDYAYLNTAGNNLCITKELENSSKIKQFLEYNRNYLPNQNINLISEMNIDQLFINLKTTECGYVLSDAKNLKLILDGLLRDEIDYIIPPIIVPKVEVDTFVAPQPEGQTQNQNSTNSTQNVEIASTSNLQNNNQSQFVQIIADAQVKANDAKNDMQKGGIKSDMDSKICNLLSQMSYRAEGWYGTIEKLDTTPKSGKGVLVIEDKNNITYRTWNNELSDGLTSVQTLLEPNSELFNYVSSLSEGDKVMFSGRFGRPFDGSCYEDQNILLENNIEEPEITFKFEKISKI